MRGQPRIFFCDIDLRGNDPAEVLFFVPGTFGGLCDATGTCYKRGAQSIFPHMPAPRKAVTKKHKEKEVEVVVPDKLYFRIGEVSRLSHLPAYVLRFWETEFPQLHPVKSGTGQRMYRRRDVETVLKIKDLLYKNGYTIPGARQHLRGESREAKAQTPLPFPKASSVEMKRLRQELKEILVILSPKANAR